MQSKSKEIEIIIAISATLDGQTTAHYLSKVINRYGNKITKLAYKDQKSYKCLENMSIKHKNGSKLRNHKDYMIIFVR